MIRISELHYYPIKSCHGTSPDQAEIGLRGIKGDREFMLVDERGLFITQRDNSRLSLIYPEWREETLILKAPGRTPFYHRPHSRGLTTIVEIWGDRCSAIDQGDETARWLNDFLGISCRLVQISEESIRRTDPVYRHKDEDQISFSDGFPFLLISETSLSDLNGRVEVPVPVDRFRPNIVITGADPYAEDRWKRIRIGKIEFTVAKSCERCMVTTIDQETGMTGHEPLRTLSRYRRLSNGKVVFGQNLIHHGTGHICVGDSVEVLAG